MLTALGYVLSVYDEYDVDGKLMNVLLAIHSAPLLDLLRKVITFFPGEEFDILSGKDSPDTVTFMDPFTMFFAYRAQLLQSMQDDFAEDAKQHVKLLLDFLKAEHRKISLDTYPSWSVRYPILWQGAKFGESALLTKLF